MPLKRPSSESDISADVIDWVCMDMAPRWRRMPARAPVQAEVPGDLAPLFGQVVDDLMRQHSIDMLWMVINLELELYLTRHPPSGGGTKLKLVGT